MTAVSYLEPREDRKRRSKDRKVAAPTTMGVVDFSSRTETVEMLESGLESGLTTTIRRGPTQVEVSPMTPDGTSALPEQQWGDIREP
jgi:hypothetical protein